jgi:hypothetical protein
MNTFITLTNHSINSKYLKNGPKTQNQIGLVLALKSHAWFFMQHRHSKQPAWSLSYLMKPVDTKKTYFGGRKWNDRQLSFNVGIQQLLSHKPSYKLQIPKKWSKNPKSIRFNFGSLSSHLVFYATSRL